jgi:hypothetical protein
MEKVDLVLLGAEGVVENGGIINKVRHTLNLLLLHFLLLLIITINITIITLITLGGFLSNLHRCKGT